MGELLGTGTRDTAAVRRRELSDFLRTRRERLVPAQVGLPPGRRRRTPGLRREEVAQLAGVGVTWYTWLEQGRDIQPSGQVLEAVSRTLRLDPHERAHLYRLANVPAPEVTKDCAAVSPEIQLMLTQLEPFPACVKNARTDLLAYNRTYDRMLGGLSAIPVEQRNTTLLLFTDPSFQARIVGWEEKAPMVVAQFRAAMARHVAEPAWKQLLRTLRHQSPLFADLWDRHDVREPENLTKEYLTDDVGLVRLRYTNLWFGPRSETLLTTYTPADPESAVRLERLYEIAVDATAPPQT
ncbi:helix-turn-helix transcriptional regulator [Actinocatenispora sera]|uniref:Transcriptional regulator n=1 Tax=Actinocatenispora sera TaxID=390989 RepID=A0A810KWT2_9ACTN|nr:helix-turn-helix transcriptional regulator [Actinocatenispora sera]BCJ27534.1 transcriptional regulator [Actinocatenispora sera]